MSFKEIGVNDIKMSPSELFGGRLPLIAAGDREKHNLMTAGWGLLGKLWGKDVAVVFIRPQRYTYEFVDSCDMFTVNVLGSQYENAIKICGAESGRDGDKFVKSELSPMYTDGTTAVEQSELVLICKKIAAADLSPEQFFDSSIADFYKANDYHKVFIGEITRVIEQQ